jgi:hypothetical protein
MLQIHWIPREGSIATPPLQSKMPDDASKDPPRRSSILRDSGNRVNSLTPSEAALEQAVVSNVKSAHVKHVDPHPEVIIAAKGHGVPAPTGNHFLL